MAANISLAQFVAYSYNSQTYTIPPKPPNFLAFLFFFRGEAARPPQQNKKTRTPEIKSGIRGVCELCRFILSPKTYSE
jgi:hypothetical protein